MYLAFLYNHVGSLPIAIVHVPTHFEMYIMAKEATVPVTLTKVGLPAKTYVITKTIKMF